MPQTEAKKSQGAYPIEIKLLDKTDFIGNNSLQQSLLEIIRPSYVDPLPVFNREIQRCNKLYLATQNKVLVAFFLVSWESLEFQDKVIPAIFLGLSATSAETKNTGIVRNLYSRMLEDVKKWEDANQQQILIWATTATPSAYYGVSLLFPQLEPRSDGSYSKQGEQLAFAIRKKMGWENANKTRHPLVLHNVAKGTRYSPTENQRISQVMVKNNFTLFSKLAVDEKNQDRILLICQTPSPEEPKLLPRAKL